MIRKSIVIDFDVDVKFWHLIPSVNINLHSRELEFEWLCLGIYATTERNNRVKKLAENNRLWNVLPKVKSLFKTDWNYKNHET